MSGRALVLTDGKAGHENQSKAFARALGCGFDLVEVRFNFGRIGKLCSYIHDHLPSFWPMNQAVLGARTADRTFANLHELCGNLQGKGYSAVLGTGSGTFFAAKVVARRLGVKCGVVLYPRGYDLGSFDCILAPSFDSPAKLANIVEIPANLVANDAAFYEKGVVAFRARYSGATDNLVGVIVGGPNKCSTMSPEWMKARLDEIFAANAGAQLCVTTSRRTPFEVESVVDSYPWAYRLIYSRDRFNPIPAFVQLAKRLYVTAESTGMLSEACTFGNAEVVALDNLNPGPHKFRRFVENLRRDGYVDGCRKVDLSAEFARARELMGL
ncbi:MAG: mitochondrial fission ELM1 family protein [Kiritimatiellae bacterium]|nr:mitochondrial fission ELM1 family protein [Kiritimatiellia bacterium]